MTNIPGTVSQPRMGRPTLNVKETKVRLMPETRARIVALVGPNRMAAFIREAIDAELVKREEAREISANASGSGEAAKEE